MQRAAVSPLLLGSVVGIASGVYIFDEPLKRYARDHGLNWQRPAADTDQTTVGKGIASDAGDAQTRQALDAVAQRLSQAPSGASAEQERANNGEQTASEPTTAGVRGLLQRQQP